MTVFIVMMARNDIVSTRASARWTSAHEDGFKPAKKWGACVESSTIRIRQEADPVVS